MGPASQARPGELWVLRHGETDWSAGGRHTGRNDLSLNADGEAQARELKGRLDGVNFERVICSPLQRAEQTCRIAGFFDQAELDPDAMEWDYGAYEGRTRAEICEERPGWVPWTDGFLDGEPIVAVAERATRVLARVQPDVDAGRRVAIFAHGHFLRILTACWLEQSPVLAQRIALEPARVSILGFEHETPVIRRWNC